jgi:3-hydroxyacyl-[acyl-carrier-protein] dehydratase
MAELPEVQSLLSHRGQWLLLDEITELGEDHITATATFSPEQVEGHFPGQPVVPGVLLLEALAQCMACLHVLRERKAEAPPATPFLAGFEKVRFKAPVLPPATVRLSVRLVEQRFGLVTAKGQVSLDGRRVVLASLTGAMVPRA